MTQQTSGYSASAGSAADPSTADVAREQAGQVGRTAGDAGQRVAGTAAQQAGQVGQEARRQARDLLGQAQGQLNDQARNGQQQAREGLHALARELREMADGGDRHGPASDLAAQAADKLGDLADWLGRREPGDLIDEVRALARRRPGAFLLGAAAAGVLAGRLTRGAVDAQRESSGPYTGGSYTGGPDTGHPPAPVWTPPAAGPATGYSAGAPLYTPPETPQPGPRTVAPERDYAPPGSTAPTPPEGLPIPPAQEPLSGPAHEPAAPAYRADAPVPSDVEDEAGRTLPPRTEATTVGEYVESLERDVPPYEDRRPDAGGPR
jgi:hypothetical protein